jgi:hypothetical protein
MKRKGFIGWIVVNDDTYDCRNHCQYVLDHPLGQGESIRGHREDGRNSIYPSCSWPKKFRWVISSQYSEFKHDSYSTYTLRGEKAYDKWCAVIGYREYDNSDDDKETNHIFPCSQFVYCYFCGKTAEKNAVSKIFFVAQEWGWGELQPDEKMDYLDLNDSDRKFLCCKTCQQQLADLNKTFNECSDLINDIEKECTEKWHERRRSSSSKNTNC